METQLLTDKVDSGSSTNAPSKSSYVDGPESSNAASSMRIRPAIERAFPLLVGHLKSGRLSSSLQLNLSKILANFDADWASDTGLSFLNTHTICFVDSNQTRQVNAYILSCHSEYFRALFQYATSTTINIKLDWLEPILPQIIEVIESVNITGCHVTITDENCGHYFLAGDFLQLENLRSACLEQICQSFRAQEIFVSIWASTFNFDLPDLISSCVLPILRNFGEIRHTNNFLDLKVDALIRILEHRMLTCSSELRVIETIGNWMAHQPSHLEERKRSLNRLLCCVRIRQLTPAELEAAEKLPAAIECREFRECLKFLRSSRPDPAKIPFFLFEQKALTRCQGPRRPLRVVLALVTEAVPITEAVVPDALATCLFYNHQAKTWGREAPDRRSLPNPRDCDHTLRMFQDPRIGRHKALPRNICCVSAGHRVYLIGGWWCGKAHRLVLCFNSRDPSRQWLQKSRMNEARFGHCCAAVGGYIYAAGGIKTEAVSFNSVERMALSGDNNNWSHIDPMLTSRYLAAATEYHGKLIVAGGMEDGRTLDTAEMYCPESGVWTVLSGGRLSKKRHSLGLVTCCDWVYAVCGRYENHHMRSIERWQEGRNWKKCIKIETGRSNFGCVAMDSRVYIFGGFNGDYVQTSEWVDVSSRASQSRPLLLGSAEPVPLKGESFAACLFDVEMDDYQSNASANIDEYRKPMA